MPCSVSRKPWHEVDARLLAVGDTADVRVRLGLDGQMRRVAFGIDERIAIELPARPELFGFGEPAGLRQTARQRSNDTSCVHQRPRRHDAHERVEVQQRAFGHLRATLLFLFERARPETARSKTHVTFAG